MAFTTTQITSLVEITGLSFDDLTDYYTTDLNAAQETAVAADIALWETSKNKFLKLQGGTKGVYLDSNDQKNAIRARVAKHLGLSSFSSGQDYGMGTLQIG